ncbi:MAG: outer membrane beta-barrel protein [Pseudomonadales bacterium]
MKNLKSTGHTLVLLATACLALAVDSAMADDAGWYLGSGFGVVAADYKAADFDDGSTSQTRIDDDDTAWKLFAGYRFNRYLAVEGGYVDLHNEFDEKTTFSAVSDGTGGNFASLPNGPVSVDIDEITGFATAAVGSYPLTNRFVVSGKLGAVFWEAEQTALDLQQREASLDGTDALVGIGAEYRFDNGIAIRGEAERYFDVGETDQDVVSVSVLYQF